MPARFTRKWTAIDAIMQRTGYGRRVVEAKMDELEHQGVIRLIPDPGHKQARLISDDDIEKVVAALTPQT